MNSAAAQDPLLQGFGPGAPIGWRSGKAVSVEQFLARAAALARRVPPDGHCVNSCEDRLNFLAAFAAALMARSVTLLPQSRAPKVLRELGDRYARSSRISDEDVGNWRESDEPAGVPAFPREQVAVILFTSGTTGTPSPHAKTWGSLVAGARALRARVPDIAGAALVGAVPPQHMWGLESTVMLPLQSGCAVDVSCPLLPAEIAAALYCLPAPRWLVATPAHLRACALSAQPLPALAGVLCSTAPLPQETAQRIEELGGAAVFEIYGSTETGAIATRRSARTQVFEAVAGIEISIAGEQAIARQGHLPAPVELNDVLQASGSGKFIVRGRASDLVKVGGKRSSLAALTAELNRIPGVLDGVFWLPDAAQGEARPAAFAVAPGIEKTAILAQLRDRIDPVFLPRPLLLVEALPRNAAGKLSREALKALAGPAQVGPHWQQVAASHPALAGHFPGNPVVPGAWLLALVERAARRQFGDDLQVLGMPDARFRSPLRPEVPFRILLERVADDRVAFRIEGEAALVADGTLVLHLRTTPSGRRPMSTAWLEQRERGSFAAVRLITWITRTLGHRTGRALLMPICGYFIAFTPRARRASRAYLERIFAAPVGIGQVYRHFHVFASALLDRIEILSRGGSRFDMRVHGWPALEAILARGRGCLLVGSHLGSAEILRAFGERQHKLPINLVMHEGNAGANSRWLRQMAPELAARLILAGEPGTLLRVRECLERGEVVAMLGDRPFGSERTTRCEFLGASASFPSGPMLTAAVLGVPVAAFFCLHVGDLRYDVHFEVLAERIELGAGPRDAALAPWIERFVRRLEAHARQSPYNWFNFYDFWQEN